MKRIGIMGGTFNPIHIGHLMIAQRALEEYHLDQVIFLPNGNPPHKADADVLDASHRAAMVRLAIQGHEGFSFSDMEIKKSTLSYTSETLETFRQMDPEASYYFILGADSLDYLGEWHEPQEIFDRAVILSAPRGEYTIPRMEEKVQELKKCYTAEIGLMHLPNVEISSSWIRQTVKEGYSVKYYVPDAVEAYIKAHSLYR